MKKKHLQQSDLELTTESMGKGKPDLYKEKDSKYHLLSDR